MCYVLNQWYDISCATLYVYKRDSLKIFHSNRSFSWLFNPLIAELNPICHLLTLLGAHHILHISRIRVNNPCSKKVLRSSRKISDILILFKKKIVISREIFIKVPNIKFQVYSSLRICIDKCEQTDIVPLSVYRNWGIPRKNTVRVIGFGISKPGSPLFGAQLWSYLPWSLVNKTLNCVWMNCAILKGRIFYGTTAFHLHWKGYKRDSTFRYDNRSSCWNQNRMA